MQLQILQVLTGKDIKNIFVIINYLRTLQLSVISPHQFLFFKVNYRLFMC